MLQNYFFHDIHYNDIELCLQLPEKIEVQS